MKKMCVLVAISLNLLGCVSIADSEKTLASKSFLAPSDQAVVYIYREPERIFSVNMLSPTIDGKKIGETDSGTYLYKQLPPGKHTFNVEGSNVADLEIDLKNKQLYFLRLTDYSGCALTNAQPMNCPPIRQGLYEVMDEIDGKRDIMSLKLVEIE